MPLRDGGACITGPARDTETLDAGLESDGIDPGMPLTIILICMKKESPEF